MFGSHHTILQFSKGAPPNAKRKALAKYLYKFMRKHIRKEINNMRNLHNFLFGGAIG